MKNIKYLFLVVAGTLASCTVEYDRIFDQSAAERMAATLAEYQKILIDAPNGWTMDYYAEYPEDRIGGYVLIVSFDADGFATIACETDIAEEGGAMVAKKVKSTYNLISDQGPVLTFNSYNRLLHQFSEPLGTGDIDGYAGDYEFVFMEASADKIVMKGKKNNNTITLRKLSAGTDWSEYINAAINMDDNNFYPAYRVSVNGSDIGTVRQSDDRKLKFLGTDGQAISWIDSHDNSVTTMNMTFTPEGFYLYEPVEMYGATFDEFLWDDTVPGYKSPDGSMVLTGFYPDDYIHYEDFLDTYTMTYVNQSGTAGSRNVSIIEGSGGFPNLTISGFTAYANCQARYDRGTGSIKIGYQKAGTFLGFNMEIWYYGGGYVYKDPSTMAEGTMDPSNNTKVITVKVPTYEGFILVYVNSIGGYAGYLGIYINMVFTER